MEAILIGWFGGLSCIILLAIHDKLDDILKTLKGEDKNER